MTNLDQIIKNVCVYYRYRYTIKQYKRPHWKVRVILFLSWFSSTLNARNDWTSKRTSDLPNDPKMYARDCERERERHRRKIKRKMWKWRRLNWNDEEEKTFHIWRNTWRFIISRTKRRRSKIKSNGKLLHTMVEENACTNTTHLFRKCVCERVCMCECVLHQNVNCETSTSFFNMYSHFIYVLSVFLWLCVCPRAKVVVKQMCAFYVSFLFFVFLLLLLLLLCFLLSFSSSLSLSLNLSWGTCFSVYVCVPETICRYGVSERVADECGKYKRANEASSVQVYILCDHRRIFHVYFYVYDVVLCVVIAVFVVKMYSTKHFGAMRKKTQRTHNSSGICVNEWAIASEW